ncbi:MAG: hypothetical protein KatS3mg098_023 [Candidatus Parcubacteria bacterium]|nr:hypothetical protein [Patescibacteria group bacterium]BCX15794.1 MAG: hypothetical protein KatS3mg098_023 [Candidatus Parcubacteria bacterium]
MAAFNFSAVPRSSSQREAISSLGVPWRIFVIALVVFILTLVIWAGMEFGYSPYLKSEIKKIDAKLESLSSTFSEAQQKEFSSFYSQLYNIKSLAASHPYPSKLFEFLETSLYPTVRLTNFQADLGSGEIRMEGVIVSYNDLANQLSVFQKNPNVESVSLDTSRQLEVKDGGGVFFSSKIILNKKFLFNSEK